VTAYLSLNDAVARLGSVSTIAEFNALVGQISVQMTGKTGGVVYAGGVGSNKGMAASLAFVDLDTRFAIINNVDAGLFLVNEDVATKIGSLINAERSVSNQLSGAALQEEISRFILRGEPGRIISQNYAAHLAATNAEVRVFAYDVAPDSIFRNVEFPELLKGNGTIEGVAVSKLRALGDLNGGWETVEGRAAAFKAVSDVSHISWVSNTERLPDGSFVAKPAFTGHAGDLVFEVSKATPFDVAASVDARATAIVKNIQAYGITQTLIPEASRSGWSVTDAISFGNKVQILGKIGIVGGVVDGVLTGVRIYGDLTSENYFGAAFEVAGFVAKFGLGIAAFNAGASVGAAFGPVGALAAGLVSAGVVVFGIDHYLLNWGREIIRASMRRGDDPLILDLDNDGITLTTLAGSDVHFDFARDGFAERTGWVSPRDAILVRVANGNGLVDSASELFGSATRDGWDVLETFDLNADGKIDAGDTVWSTLKAWRDANGNAVVDAGETVSLNDVGIASIGLNRTDVTGTNAGHDRGFRGTVTKLDGSTIGAETIYFQTAPRDTVATAEIGFVPSAAIAKLPNFSAMGTLNSVAWKASQDASFETLWRTLTLDAANLDPTALRTRFVDAVMKWASVDQVTMGSRGQFVDARKLAFLEKFEGIEYREVTASGVTVRTFPATSAAGQQLTAAFDRLVDTLTTMFLVQVPGSVLQHGGSIEDVLASPVFAYALLDLRMEDGVLVNPTAGVDNVALLVANLLPTEGSNLFGRQVDYVVKALSGLTGIVDVAFGGSAAALAAAVGSSLSGIVDPDVRAVALAAVSGRLRTGTSGEDALVGGAGADVALGGQGVDVIKLGAGSDIIILGKGDGNDRIVDEGTSVSDRDLLILRDVLVSEMSFQRVADELRIVLPQSQVITVAGFFTNWSTEARGIDAIRFADGAMIDRVGIQAATISVPVSGSPVINGSTLNDVLQGTSADERFNLGSANAGSGSDIVIWSKGDGNDTFTEGTTIALDRDILFLSDVRYDDVRIERTTTLYPELRITIVESGEMLKLQGFLSNWGTATFVNGRTGIDAVMFADGVWFDRTVAEGVISTWSTGASESISGTAFSEFMDGRGGNDTLSGGVGNDLYIWRPGDGVDTIVDGGSQNVLRLVGVASTQAQFVQDGTSGWVVVGDERIVLSGQLTSTGGVSSIEFSETILGRSAIAQRFLTDRPGASSTFNGTSLADTIIAGSGNNVMTGNDGNDVLSGGTGQDVIYGNGHNDILNGGSGHDALYGGAGMDTLVGGAGSDLLEGGDDADVYRWSLGDGSDQIRDSGSSTTSGIDVLWLDNVLASDVRIVRQDLNIVSDDRFAGNDPNVWVEIISTGERIEIRGQNEAVFNTREGIEEIRFANGVTWNRSQIDASTICRGTDGRDEITPSSASNVIVGGLGDDLIEQGYNGFASGSDAYVWRKGHGNDIIVDRTTPVWETSFDTLRLDDCLQSDVVFQREDFGSDTDLLVVVGGERIRIVGQFAAPTAASDVGIETIRFMDGTMWDRAAILSRVTYMGTNVADVITPSMRGDLVIGGLGDDVINSFYDSWNDQNGSDTYVWSKGDGNDLITDTRYQYGPATDIDTLRLVDVAASEATLQRQGNDLRVSIGVETITIVSHFSAVTSGPSNGIERIFFADGIAIDRAAINAFAMAAAAWIGTNGDDVWTGGAGVDVIHGDGGNDVLSGGFGGADLVTGGLGNDRLMLASGGIDTLDGGAGVDTLDASQMPIGIWIDLVANQRGEARVGSSTGAQIAVIDRAEHIVGSSYADVLAGDGLSNRLQGGGGADSLLGRGGDDILIGEAGDDMLTGGVGVDAFVFDFATTQGSDRIVDFVSGFDRVDLQNVGFIDAAATYAAVLDIDGVATLSIGSDRITFEGVSKAQLAASDFWL
jgi:Ca2+-binding RTX toxin-like protein